MNTVQGNMSVRDYAWELESMAIQFLDVSEHKITQIFWLGLHQYLCLYLIEWGLNPEHTALEWLISYAKWKEEAVKGKKQEEQTWQPCQKGRRWDHYMTRMEEPQGPKPEERNPRYNNQPQTASCPANERKTNQTNGVRPPPQAHTNDGNKRPPQSCMSPEEHDHLHAEQWCFTCKETGHESHNCPNHWQAKAPTMSTGSINLTAMEARGKRACKVNLSVGMAHIRPEDEVEGKRHQPHLIIHDLDDYVAPTMATIIRLEGGPSQEWQYAPLVLCDLEEIETEVDQICQMFCRHYHCDLNSNCFTVTYIEQDDTYEISDEEDVSLVHWCTVRDVQRDEFCVNWILSMNSYDCEVLQYSVPFISEIDVDYHPVTSWLQNRLRNLAQHHQYGLTLMTSTCMYRKWAQVIEWTLAMVESESTWCMKKSVHQVSQSGQYWTGCGSNSNLHIKVITGMMTQIQTCQCT